MKEKVKNPVNNQHIYGLIVGVRFGVTKDGQTGINLRTATDNKSEKHPYSHQNVKMFTKDEAVIAEYKALESILAVPSDQRTKEQKSKLRVSLDGAVVNGEGRVKGSDKTYETLEVLTRPDKVRLGVDKQEGETRNRLDMIGKVGSVDFFNDKNGKEVARVRVASDFYPRDNEKEKQTTWDTAFVREDNRFAKKSFQDLKSGAVKKGDTIDLSGQLDESERVFNGEKQYQNCVYANSLKAHVKKEAQTQTEAKSQEVKATEKPAQAAAPAKKTEQAAAPKQTATTAKPKKVTRKPKGPSVG